MVEEAARLALSVLPYAYTLSAAETQRALLQCREQGSALLENACRAIEEVNPTFLSYQTRTSLFRALSLPYSNI